MLKNLRQSQAGAALMLKHTFDQVFKGVAKSDIVLLCIMMQTIAANYVRICLEWEVTRGQSKQRDAKRPDITGLARVFAIAENHLWRLVETVEILNFEIVLILTKWRGCDGPRMRERA